MPRCLTRYGCRRSSWSKNREALVLKGESFVVGFDTSLGVISSLSSDGIELIQSGLRPNFWRAPTDNDRGNDMPGRCAPWKEASRDWEVTTFEIEQLGSSIYEIRFEGEFPNGVATNTVVYTVYGTGEIAVDHILTPGEGELPELPRFGMQMVIPGGFETVTWFGRGPHESYWDRKTGARVGIWSGTVDEQFVDYSEPQENGNKTDVRWVSSTNADGIGLLAVGEPLIAFSRPPLHHRRSRRSQTHARDGIPQGHHSQPRYATDRGRRR